MALTRRQFLFRVGQVGGYGAAFTMMRALGLLPIAASEAQAIRGVTGHGTRVVILGDLRMRNACGEQNGGQSSDAAEFGPQGHHVSRFFRAIIRLLRFRFRG